MTNNSQLSIYIFLIIFNILFALNPQIKEEFPSSIYINPEINYPLETLLNFEEIGYEIENPVERSKYYFIIAHLLNQKIIELNVRSDNIIEVLSDLIKSYEIKLLKDPYTVNYDISVSSYDYKYIKFSEKSVIKKVFYKQASALKKQYVDRNNAFKRKVDLLSDYLISLREDYVIDRTSLININYKDSIEEKFYSTIQDMLSDNLILETKLNPLKVLKDQKNNIISTIEIKNINGDDIIFTKDFEYFEDNLLASIREREGGRILKEILYGQNKYSDKFYNFIFDSDFQTLNYDNFTEVHFQLNNNINYIDFFTFNGVKIGSIHYEYDDWDRLIDEKWYKGDRLLVREFNCFYESGKGDYRVVEKNQYGEIVFQDIVTSKDAHIKLKENK